MTNIEKRVINEIYHEVETHVKKHDEMPLQVTVSDKQYDIVVNLWKQGYKFLYEFEGNKIRINIQCCSKIIRVNETIKKRLFV